MRVNFDPSLGDENIFEDIHKVIELADLMTEAHRRASRHGMVIIDRTARLVRSALAEHELITVNSSGTHRPGKADQPVCPAPWTHLWIARTGEAKFCLQGETIGDVTQSSIHEVYNSPTARRIRRSFLAGDYTSCKRRQCPRGIRNVGTGLGAAPDEFDEQRLSCVRDAME